MTGGGRGIGRSIAQAGADVAVVARSRAEPESVAREIEQSGRRGVALVIDLMDPAAMVQMRPPQKTIRESGDRK